MKLTQRVCERFVSAAMADVPETGCKQNAAMLRALGAPTLGGLPVYANNRIPRTRAKFQLALKLDLEPAFRAAYDQWLREWFGEEPFILWSANADGFGREGLFMHPDTLRTLQDAGRLDGFL